MIRLSRRPQFIALAEAAFVAAWRLVCAKLDALVHPLSRQICNEICNRLAGGQPENDPILGVGHCAGRRNEWYASLDADSIGAQTGGQRREPRKLEWCEFAAKRGATVAPVDRVGGFGANTRSELALFGLGELVAYLTIQSAFRARALEVGEWGELSDWLGRRFGRKLGRTLAPVGGGGGGGASKQASNNEPKEANKVQCKFPSSFPSPPLQTSSILPQKLASLLSPPLQHQLDQIHAPSWLSNRASASQLWFLGRGAATWRRSPAD